MLYSCENYFMRSPNIKVITLSAVSCSFHALDSIHVRAVYSTNYGLNSGVKWESNNSPIFILYIDGKIRVEIKLNNFKYRLESSIRCCFWSIVISRGLHLAQNFHTPKYLWMTRPTRSLNNLECLLSKLTS